LNTETAKPKKPEVPVDLKIEQTLFRFVDFYLSPMLTQKSIDLLKVRLDRRGKRSKDALLREVKLIRDAMQILSAKRKTMIAVFHPETPLEKTYLEVLRLEPSDCLILTSESLFQIPKEQLSLALKTSVESIEFRRKKLQSIFEEEGIPLKEIEKLVNATTSGRTETVPEKLTLIQRFQRLPLALRFSIESLTVLMSLLALLWIIPEIRNRYENSIQKRINDYLIESSLVDSPPPAGTNAQAPIPSEDAAADTDEENTVTKSSSDDVASRKQPKVNEGETWRFSFTGTATSDIEGAATSAIQRLNLTTPKPTTVPGGIQFDFNVPVDQVIALKGALEQKTYDIQQKNSSAGTGSVANFSWYKKKNMGARKIPSGQVQIIVWISTL
jgi:hypothetical protein